MSSISKNGFSNKRRDDEMRKAENYARIVSEDQAAIAKARAALQSCEASAKPVVEG